MLQPIRYFSTFLFLCWPFWQVFAQTLPPLQPEQDCINAIPVCQNVYVQTNSYTGEGNDPNEIGDDSCLGTEENNDVWYIFTVQVSGNLCFTITPNDPLDDYDWAVYNLTTANCNDIRNTPSLEVSCNFAPNVGCNGLTGPNNDTMGSCARQNEPCVPVLAGQTYAVNVSNYSETNFGYTLDFSASSAVIFDNIPPELVAANSSCADVSVVFSENVLCSSVEPTDFTISGPDSVLHSVSAVMSENCAGGGNFDNLFALTISPPILVPGLYTIDLSGEVEDNCGNIGTEGSAIIDIQVNTVNVTANPDTICEGSTTRLTTDVDPASAVAYLWMPGGMTQPDPQVSPDTTTTYFVGVTDTAGCLFSGSVTVAVEPLPDATFGVSDSIVCPEESVLLTYQGDAGPDAVFAWNFGDAVVMSGADAGPYELRWASPGTKTISLKVKERGCTSLEYQQQVEVIPPPTAEFSLPAGVCNFSQAQIQYTGNASPTATFDWDFDGGVVTNGTGDGPGPHAVEWNAPGPREVSLIVTDNGCVSEVGLQRLQVFNLPQASIAPVEGQCLPGNQFRFYYDGGSNVLTYQWDFGDSTANDLSHPLHTYRSAGTKTVQLTVTDANQCQNTASTTVEVFAPPSADFTLANACQQDSLQITNLSTGPGGQPLAAFRWEFGDGGSTTAAAPVHQYTQPGSYQVILIAESSQGCKDTTRQMLTVYPRPAVRFTSQDVCEGLPAAFTNTSTIRSDIASDVIQEFIWSFGDGQSLTGEANPQHTYAAAGTYTVQLEAISDKGCSSTGLGKVEIFALPEFPQTEDQAVCFGDVALLSAIPPKGSRVEWFTDAQAAAPFHEGPSYISPPVTNLQTFYVESISKEGCRSGKKEVQLGLHNEGQGFILRSDSALEIPHAIVNFQMIGSIIGEKFLWDFGDGITSTAEQAAHEYQYPGKYAVTLEVTDVNGCDYELSTTVEVKKIVLLHFPTGFSPNGDGINDELFMNHRLLQQFQLKIFNRHGQVVYETTDPNFRWNGRSKQGFVLQEGVYVFAIKAVDISGLTVEETGTITLLR